MGDRSVDDKASDTLVVDSGEGFWTGSSTLPHLHHFLPSRGRRPAPRQRLSPARDAAAPPRTRPHGAQSPGVPAEGGGAGPDGSVSPAQIVSRPQDRSTRPKLPCVAICPPGPVVRETEPGSTTMDTRTRPLRDLASTCQGRAGSEAGVDRRSRLAGLCLPDPLPVQEQHDIKARAVGDAEPDGLHRGRRLHRSWGAADEAEERNAHREENDQSPHAAPCHRAHAADSGPYPAPCSSAATSTSFRSRAIRSLPAWDGWAPSIVRVPGSLFPSEPLNAW
jgi:hypothetical protein